MRGHYGSSVDAWRGVTSLALVAAAAILSVVFGVMAMLILHQDS